MQPPHHLKPPIYEETVILSVLLIEFGASLSAGMRPLCNTHSNRLNLTDRKEDSLASYKRHRSRTRHMNAGWLAKTIRAAPNTNARKSVIAKTIDEHSSVQYERISLGAQNSLAVLSVTYPRCIKPKESAVAIVVTVEAVETEVEAEADGARMGVVVVVVSEATEVEVVVMVEVAGEVMEGRLIGASKAFGFTRNGSIVGHDTALFLEHNLQLMAKERCLRAG
jgi:hypothetical protein